MESEIRGCSVLVIGASAGIGRSAAKSFAAGGANVMAVGRREENLRALADEVALKWCAADITEPDEPARIIAETIREFGGIDILLNVAAVSPMVLLSQATPEELLSVFNSNVVGPSQVCRSALAHLNENAIVAFVSSETVGRPRRGLVPYGASKAALEELVNGWRVENPQFRFATVRVGATIGTDFGRDFGGDLLGECLNDWIKGGHLRANMMNPADVGDALAETLAIGFLHPTVELCDFSLRPPGPLADFG